ncbi:MAG: LOG family protein [Acidimicrobiales bacterium]|nr:LOG family protein [Acidimicrobiales bacterium]
MANDQRARSRRQGEARGPGAATDGGDGERRDGERTGPASRAEIDAQITQLLNAAGAHANRDQLREILTTAIRLATDGTDRLDLKITNAALREMARAFRVFAPYRQVQKVTMFGSARTLPVDPLYAQARELAATLARNGWMVVTGAGAGIMAAGLEGAGREHAFGINIRLPFEQEVDPLLVSDPKLVEMKYFFTRKLMLMKESDGYVVLPGGFGTLDEAFELLTLMQTGKGEPSPIVLLDVPGGTYWREWERFVSAELARSGLISAEDRFLYRITDDVVAAASEILGFYRNYHSRRWVGDLMVIRLRRETTDEELEDLNDRFGDLCRSGHIERTGPLAPEEAEGDQLSLPRLVLAFDAGHHGRLRQLIDALNALPERDSDL